MTRPLSNDLRERIVRAVDGGLSRNAAAKKYEVGISTVVNLIRLWRETGSWEPKKVGGNSEHKLKPHTELVLKILNEKPDITLLDMKARLGKDKIAVSKSAIDRFLNALGLSYKKNAARQRTRQARREGGAGGVEAKPRAA